MWAWTKRFSITRTPQQSTEPRQKPQSDPALLAATKALCELAKGQQKLLAQQQDTLDRIVTARYERPVERMANTAAEQMPLWGMSDQSDVRPDPTAAGLANIGEESDTAWIASVN